MQAKNLPRRHTGYPAGKRLPLPDWEKQAKSLRRENLPAELVLLLTLRALRDVVLDSKYEFRSADCFYASLIHIRVAGTFRNMDI